MENIKNILNDIYHHDNKWHFRIINSNTGEIGTITDANKTKLGFGKDYKIWVEFPFQDGYNSNSFILTQDDINKLSAGQKIKIKADQPMEENPYSTIEYSKKVFSDQPRIPKPKNSGNADFLTGLAVGSFFKKGGLTPEKARMILHEGTVHGHPITDKQRRYFGVISNGYPMRKKSHGGYMEKGGEVELQFLKGMEIGKSHWWAPKNVSEITKVLFDKDKNVYEIQTEDYSLNFSASQMKSLMQEGEGLDKEGVEYELIRDEDDDTTFIYIPMMNFERGGNVENLVDKLRPKFGKAIDDYGITEVFFVDGAFHITSMHDMDQSWYDAIEKEALSLIKYTIVSEDGTIVKSEVTAQEVIDYANTIGEYERRDNDEEEINNIEDAIRFLKSNDFTITDKFESGGFIGKIDFVHSYKASSPILTASMNGKLIQVMDNNFARNMEKDGFDPFLEDSIIKYLIHIGKLTPGQYSWESSDQFKQGGIVKSISDFFNRKVSLDDFSI